MCGIVGYIGFRSVSNLLHEGLHRLEYQGYDSAGIAVFSNGEIVVRKRAGRVSELASLVQSQPVKGTIGIGHTRWATHGGTTDENSHPHVGGNGEVVIVHNIVHIDRCRDPHACCLIVKPFRFFNLLHGVVRSRHHVEWL